MKRIAPLLVVCLIFALAATAGAQCNIFMKIDGIPGTSDAPGHRDFVKSNSFIIAPNTNDKGGIVSITKALDKASPLLARHAERGTSTSGEMHITGHGYANTVYSCSFEELQIRDVQRDDLSEVQRGLLGGKDQGLERITMRVSNMKWKTHAVGSGEQDEPTPMAGRVDHSEFVIQMDGRDIPLAAFGIGIREKYRRFLFLPKETPSGLLSRDRVPTVALALLGEDGPHHLLSTGPAGIEMAGTVNPAQVGILSDNEPRFVVILSPTNLKFSQ